jgi:hypothetical protein
MGLLKLMRLRLESQGPGFVEVGRFERMSVYVLKVWRCGRFEV